MDPENSKSSGKNPQRKEIAQGVQQAMPMAWSQQKEEMVETVTHEMIYSKPLKDGFEQMEQIQLKMKASYAHLMASYYTEQEKNSGFMDKLERLFDEVGSMDKRVQELSKVTGPIWIGKLLAMKYEAEEEKEEKDEESDMGGEDVDAEKFTENIELRNGFATMKTLIEEMSNAHDKLVRDYQAQQFLSKSLIQDLNKMERVKKNVDKLHELEKLKK